MKHSSLQSQWLLLGLMLIAGPLQLMAQATPAQPQPPYKILGTLPPVDLIQTNQVSFRINELKKQPTLVMFFSPTCDHCIHQMKEMNKQIDSFNKIQVVMATYRPMQELVDFIKEFGLEARPNFKCGRDEHYQLPSFFALRSMPFLALYDNKGMLITSFEGNVEVEKLLAAFAASKK